VLPPHRIEHAIIRTPIDTLNIVGAGGLLQSTVTELWGPPGSGKSAFAYECVAAFLQDNPNGQCLIIDPEISVDLVRLEHAFKLDFMRIAVENASSLEVGYNKIYKIFATVKDQMTKGKVPDPWFIVWDTIAASKPAAEVQAAMEGKDPMNAGGMGLRARINEVNLAILLSNLWGMPVTIFLLNQARTAGFGSYTGTYDTSTGGNALKHAGHYRICFRNAKKIWDEKLMMNVGTKSRVDIEKSKFGPTVGDIPITIDDRIGGRIVTTDEAARVLWQMKILNATGGPWYKFVSDPDTSYTWEKSALSEKSGRWVSGNPETRMKCLDIMARHFRLQYYTLDVIYKKIGLKLGELGEEDQLKREEMLKNFDFAKKLVPTEKNVDKS
jgi:RecA/RadA recombinase